MARAIIAAAIYPVGLSHAYAVDSERNIQKLYNMCKMPPASTEYAICVGYISGTLLFTGLDEHRNPDVQPFALCGNPSYGAMVRAFINWAEKNPKEWGKLRIIGALLSQ